MASDPIGSFSGLASGIQWRDMVDQIMRLEQSRRLSPFQTQLSGRESRRSAWNTYGSLVGKLKESAATLLDGSAFRKFTTTAGKSPAGANLFSATASDTAQSGTYRLEVIALARAEKVSASERTSVTDALGVSGEFYVNGARIDLAATDSLTSVRDKVNAMNSGTSPSGVRATILTTSAISHRLILTADNTGSRGIELVDGAGGALQALGVVSATQSANTSPLNSAKTDTQRFKGKSQALASMLGVSSPPAITTIKIGGVKVRVDLATDTLISVMNRVNDAGGSASIAEEKIGGTTQYRLSVTGAVTADTDPDADAVASQRIVELMGFVRNGKSAQITTGQDARAVVDGFALTRRTNTISDAISGVTLDLLAANGSERSTVVNGAGLAVAKNPETLRAGTYDIALTTGTTSSQAYSDDSALLALATQPSGLPDGTYGVNITTGTVRTTSTTTTDLNNVVAPGSASPGTYAVNITQQATRSSATGALLATPPASNGTMTITAGGITQGYSIVTGQSLDTTVAGLNSMFVANGMGMTAANVGGYLKLTHDQYGTAPSFTVANSSSAINTAYGIGSTGAGTTYQNGVNIAGTIGGFAATGTDRVLIGNVGSAVDGLQVKYTGTATGAVGSVTVTDTTSVTGGTIGGQTATWDSATSKLTVTSGTLAGLALTYSGPATAGPAGNVTLTTTTSPLMITGGSIGGVAGVWDDSAKILRGAAGTLFDGLEISYTGPVASGSVGNVVVAGEIAADLTITRNPDATVASVQSFAAAYNAVVAFAEKQREQSAGLYANGTLRSMLGSLKSVLLTDVPGLSSTVNPYVRGGNVGVAISKTGQLEVDPAILKAALETNLTGVTNLFATSGYATDGEVTYKASTAKTVAGTYAVSISAAASRATRTGTDRGASFTYSASNGVSDTLSVTDSYSGVTTSSVVRQGEDLDTIVSELNTAFGNGAMSLTAERSGNSLKLGSSLYGSASSMTLSGTDALAGLGLTAGTIAGTDVQGTIGGNLATGAGQVLTASTGFDTEGLAITFSGAAAKASAGTIRFSRGLAGQMNTVSDVQSRASDGSVAVQTEQLDRSIELLNDRIDNVKSRLEIRREALIKQFTRMEEALSRFQSQSSSLLSQLKALSPAS